MNIVQGLLSAISPLPDGDLVDRLNYSYTSTLLIVCSAFISGWSFVGQPIQCWFPAYYRKFPEAGGWSTPWIIAMSAIPTLYTSPRSSLTTILTLPHTSCPYLKNITERDEKQIGYYQWVPFVLALQALLFYLPVAIWRAIYSSTGFKVKTICETCSIKANMEPEERGKNMEVVARFLIYDHDVTKSLGGRFKQALEGRIVLFSYIGVKMIYTLNALFQFLLVKWLLGTDSLLWGWNVASDLMAGKEWPETGNFPRVTLCDFAVRVLGNLHRHSVQCVLMINMFNEKIFLFLWFWFFAVAILSCINFSYWLFSSFNKSVNQKLIISYLEKIDPHSSLSLNRREQAKKFIHKTLRPDGLFLIRLISINSGDLITCQLIATLWRDYLAQNERPPSYAAAQDEPVPLLLGNNSDKKR